MNLVNWSDAEAGRYANYHEMINKGHTADPRWDERRMKTQERVSTTA